jgi:polysaccharide biosynthesis protein PslE
VELRNRRTLLLSKFRPDDRTVQEVSQEIVDTQAALEKAQAQTSSDQATDINTIHQALELDVAKGEAECAGLEARRQELIRQAAAYRAQLQNLAGSTAEYDDLSRTEKEAEENYVLYARKAEEARIADSLDQQKIANVAIAENPVEPSAPSRPNKPRNIALGTLFAGFLSLGIAFCAEYLAQPFPEVETDSKPGLHPPSDSAFVRDVIREQPELEALTGLPVFALRSALISHLETRSREESQG